MARAAQDGPGRGPRDEQDAGEEERDPDDQRPGAANDPREPAAEGFPDGASVVGAERDHEPQQPDHEPGAERAEVDERAADEHQPADPEQRERHERSGRTDTGA